MTASRGYFAPRAEEACQVRIGDLLLGEAERTLLRHFVGRAQDECERRARQAAADADALDTDRSEILLRQRLAGKADDDVERRVDGAHQRRDRRTVGDAGDGDAIRAGL